MNEILEKLNNSTFTSLRYEDLSQWEVGAAVIEDAVNRWEPLGFLALIEDDEKKKQIAVAFDNMALDLAAENERVVKLGKRYNFNCAQEDENERGVEFGVIVFPVIRRVICQIENFNYDKFLNYLEKYSFLAINYDGYNYDCDIEAEFCALLAKAIEDSFNREKNK